jgi:hypothetical protein
MNSVKYGRTYHYPFSPGTTSDDRIQHDYWRYVQAMPGLLHTEKLDGENNCLNRYGVFARSHAAPTTSPWTTAIRQRWQSMQHDLGELELFGENLYAIHSIQYSRLEQHYFVFALRCLDTWLSWEEVQFYAAAFDLPTVPVLTPMADTSSEDAYRRELLALTAEPSVFGSYDVHSEQACSREGVVSRNVAEYPVSELGTNVFKYVRKGHVKTDEHWTRNWKRAPLNHEQKKGGSHEDHSK